MNSQNGKVIIKIIPLSDVPVVELGRLLLGGPLSMDGRRVQTFQSGIMQREYVVNRQGRTIRITHLPGMVNGGGCPGRE